jgi:hypothetical protein
MFEAPLARRDAECGPLRGRVAIANHIYSLGLQDAEPGTRREERANLGTSVMRPPQIQQAAGFDLLANEAGCSI